MGVLFIGVGRAGVAEGAEPGSALLWPAGAPGAVGDEDADKPTVTFFLPAKEKANGLAVVIFPGGGYGGLATDHEGHQIGKWLNDRGIAGFMVKYRHAPKYKHPAPLQDAQRGVRLVRSRAESLGVDPGRIGAMGFSAGGHLVSTLGTHFDGGGSGASDPVERVSCRPDFLILCYPVISFIEPCTHKGSLRNLLGDSPDATLVRSLSNETQVTAETPPTFLFHTSADTGVPPENSILFYAALRKAGVPAEMHVFEKGRHGVGLGGDDPVLSRWPTLLEGWFRTRGMLE
jgi:acetyl esterase/lipase